MEIMWTCSLQSPLWGLKAWHTFDITSGAETATWLPSLWASYMRHASYAKSHHYDSVTITSLTPLCCAWQICQNWRLYHPTQNRRWWLVTTKFAKQVDWMKCNTVMPCSHFVVMPTSVSHVTFMLWLHENWILYHPEYMETCFISYVHKLVHNSFA